MSPDHSAPVSLDGKQREHPPYSLHRQSILKLMQEGIKELCFQLLKPMLYRRTMNHGLETMRLLF